MSYISSYVMPCLGRLIFENMEFQESSKLTLNRIFLGYVFEDGQVSGKQ